MATVLACKGLHNQIIKHMSDFLEKLRIYFDETPRDKIEADWAATEASDAVGPTVSEFLKNSKEFEVFKENNTELIE